MSFRELAKKALGQAMATTELSIVTELKSSSELDNDIRLLAELRALKKLARKINVDKADL